VQRRQAARVVVRDPDGRVLLLRYDDPPPMGVHWATPGGGVDPGETPREAAARELREETGWTDAVVGRELGRSRRVVVRREGELEQDETHFAVQVAQPRRPVSTAGHASDDIAAWAWLTPAEVHALPVPVWPLELPGWLEPA
jgi:ADP-ribose pyrophosphatase YjhB (NUDIX family)